MMKKGAIFVLLAAGLLALGSGSSAGGQAADLASAYLKDRIVLRPDPDFANRARSENID